MPFGNVGFEAQRTNLAFRFDGQSFFGMGRGGHGAT
jgi:hypothetical protein